MKKLVMKRNPAVRAILESRKKPCMISKISTTDNAVNIEFPTSIAAETAFIVPNWGSKI